MDGKELYRLRVNAGICPQCGKRKAVNGVLCQECRERKKAFDNMLYYKRKANGICPDCGKRKAVNGVYCPECHEKRSIKNKALHDYRIANGICTKCGKRKALGGGYVQCAECMNKQQLISANKFIRKDQMRKYDANRRKDRISKGLCSECGKPLDNNKRCCNACLEKERNRKRERVIYLKKNGICTHCGKSKAQKGRNLCPECAAKCVEKRNKYIEKHGYEQERERRQRSKEKYLALGLCVRCHKNNITGNHIYCSECLEKQREYTHKQSLKKQNEPHIERFERPSYGLCYACGKPLDREGRVCKACAAIYTKSLQNVHRSNQYWVNDNKLIFGDGKNGKTGNSD